MSATVLDPITSATAGVGMAHDICVLVAAVMQMHWHADHTIDEAIDAVCEGFELPALNERALRQHFADLDAADDRAQMRHEIEQDREDARALRWDEADADAAGQRRYGEI